MVRVSHGVYGAGTAGDVRDPVIPAAICDPTYRGPSFTIKECAMTGPRPLDPTA